MLLPPQPLPDYKTVIADPVPVSAIQPTQAPAYQPPISYPIPQDPAEDTAPDGQFLGRGGTSFGLKPELYIIPPVIDSGIMVSDGGIYAPPPPPGFYPNQPVPNNPDSPPPAGGGGAVVTPNPVQAPAKPSVAPALAPVQAPPSGPIHGMVAGYDLAKVPLWVWLVGAAFLGARLLK